MRKIFLVLSIMFLLSCENKIAGTLGSGHKYLFNCNEKELDFCLNKFSEKQNEMKVPKKWIKFDNWKEKGYDFLNGKVFYFKEGNNQIEEMYFVSILDSYPKEKDKTSVSIRAVFRFVDNNPRWIYLDDFDKSEVSKIEERFQKMILDKMKNNDDCHCENYEIIENI